MRSSNFVLKKVTQNHLTKKSRKISIGSKKKTFSILFTQFLYFLPNFLQIILLKTFFFVSGNFLDEQKKRIEVNN